MTFLAPLCRIARLSQTDGLGRHPRHPFLQSLPLFGNRWNNHHIWSLCQRGPRAVTAQELLTLLAGPSEVIRTIRSYGMLRLVVQM